MLASPLGEQGELSRSNRMGCADQHPKIPVQPTLSVHKPRRIIVFYCHICPDAMTVQIN
jgi:hypothetical protein